MRAFSGSRNGCAGVRATTGRSSSGDASDMSRHSSAQSAPIRTTTAAQHGTEERPRIGAPFAGCPVMRIGNKAARELLDIIDIVNFGERIPFERARLERVQHDVAAVAIEESSAIAAIGIGEYGAVAAFERPGQEIADRRGLSRFPWSPES